MFGLFRRKGRTSPLTQQDIVIATVMPMAISVWKKCVVESAASFDGMRLSRVGIDLWQDVAFRFLKEFVRIDPRNNANNELEDKLGMYLSFVQDRVLPNNYLFSDEEIEQIGEFMAVAAVCGLEAAIISDVERASLVHDLLPKEWIVAVGLVPEKFDGYYHKMTGKKREHRE